MIFYLFNLRKHIGIDTFQGFTFTAFGLNGRSLHLVALEQQVSENASRNKFFARHNLELYILIRECHTQDLRSRKVETTYRRSEWRSWCLKAFSPKLRLRAFTQSLGCPLRGMKERDLATSPNKSIPSFTNTFNVLHNIMTTTLMVLWSYMNGGSIPFPQLWCISSSARLQDPLMIE